MRALTVGIIPVLTSLEAWALGRFAGSPATALRLRPVHRFNELKDLARCCRHPARSFPLRMLPTAPMAVGSRLVESARVPQRSSRSSCCTRGARFRDGTSDRLGRACRPEYSAALRSSRLCVSLSRASRRRFSRSSPIRPGCRGHPAPSNRSLQLLYRSELFQRRSRAARSAVCDRRRALSCSCAAEAPAIRHGRHGRPRRASRSISWWPRHLVRGRG